MPRTNEVIGIVEAADTAVWTAALLDLVDESCLLPPDADRVLVRAKAMLEDALKGSALLRGIGDTHGFSGSLNALSWAIDSYVAVNPKRASRPDANEVQELLECVHEQLEALQARIQGQYSTSTQTLNLEGAKRFFDSLAKVLAHRATAVLTQPSRLNIAAATP